MSYSQITPNSNQKSKRPCPYRVNVAMSLANTLSLVKEMKNGKSVSP